MYKISARMLHLLQKVESGQGATLDTNSFRRFQKMDLITGDGERTPIQLTKIGIALKQVGELQEMENRDGALRKKYMHYKPKSVRRVHGETRLYAEIVCTECGKERTIFTSDLFQVRKCVTCQAENLVPMV